MLEILKSCIDLVVGLMVSLWGIVALLATWGYEILYHLHVSAPRLEGLLVGVLLAWVLLRRDSHPLLRVLSSPLKLVIDILDLAWDQLKEIVSDLWGTVWGWVSSLIKLVKSKLVSGHRKVMEILVSLKDKLLRKKE
jgi:hypothetical protein